MIRVMVKLTYFPLLAKDRNLLHYWGAKLLLLTDNHIPLKVPHSYLKYRMKNSYSPMFGTKSDIALLAKQILQTSGTAEIKSFRTDQKSCRWLISLAVSSVGLINAPTEVIWTSVSEESLQTEPLEWLMAWSSVSWRWPKCCRDLWHRLCLEQ